MSLNRTVELNRLRSLMSEGGEPQFYEYLIH
jgi:hypothetical protein